MALSTPEQASPTLPAAPTPVLAPQGQKPKKKPATTFLGEEQGAANQAGGASGKTLLGQ